MARDFTPDEARRFYDRFGAKQDLQFYENPALERLLAHADFEHAQSVFELGCGTGRLAERLLRERLSAWGVCSEIVVAHPIAPPGT